MAVAISNTASPAGVSASSNVATYSSVSTGTAADDRIIVLCVGTELASATIDSATVNYGSGAIAMTAGELATQGAVNSRVFYLPVPTGTTADFAVTFGANANNTQNHIAVYRVVGATLIPTDTGQVADTDADPISSGAITIPTNGGIVCTYAAATDTTARTWTGITESLDEDAGAFRFSTGTSTTGGTPTITVSGGNNEDATISWVTFAEGGFLLPSLYSDGDTFFSPQVNLKIFPSLYSDGDTFHSPTVSQTGGPQTLNPSLYSDADTFFTPQVNLKIFPSLYSDGDTFFSPKVSFRIYPSLFTDGDTFFTPQVNLKIFPSLYSDADTFYTPTVSYDQTLTASLFVNTQQFPPEPPVDTFWQHTVAVSSGTQTLEPSLYSDADNFYSPTIKLYLLPSLYTDGDTFFSPNVIQLVKPDLYTDADTFFGPTVNLKIYPNLYTDADTFFSPTIKLYLRPNLFTDADTFYSPNVIQLIKPALYTDADSFFSATITTGGVTLSPSLYTDADTFFTHLIKSDIDPSLYLDTDTFYSPKVSYRIYPGLYTDADTFYTHHIALFQGLRPDLYVDADTFYTPLIEQFDIRSGRFPHRNPTFRSQRMPVFAKFR